MTFSPRFSSSSRRVGVVWLLVATALTCLVPGDAAAQHKARLAGNLAQRLTQSGGNQVDVIVELPQAEVDRISRSYGLRVKKRLGMGAVLSGDSAQIQRVASDANVGALSIDDVVVSTMAVTTQSTGANLLWQGSEAGRRFGGLTGQGVVVAVLDSGIAPHGDLARRLALSLDFTDDEGEADAYGHGTHVAGIIAGSGAGSRADAGSQYVGMAPGADLISLRVLGADGTGHVSDVIEGIEWAIANKARHKIRVVNLSLGHATTNAYRDDPLGQAVERAVRAGLVVVASAGNLGQTQDGAAVVGMVVSPGFTPGALTAGALNTRGTVLRSDDGVASYSSRGPVGDQDDPSTWIIKPDVVAPGNAIVAAGAQSSYLWENYPSRRVIGENGGTYLTLSGSSMATAVTSGAVAQLLQLQPKLTPAEVKFALQFTAQRLDGFGIIEQGAGSINVPLAAALVASRYVFSAPTSVQIGGEMVSGSEIAFASSIVWGSRGGGGLDGNSIVWGSRGGGLGGNSIVWGSRGGGLGGNSIVWGSRGGGLGGDSIVWGSRGGGLGGDSIVWGSRGGGLGGDSIVWGSRGGGLGGDSIVWGSRGGGLGGDSIVWGSRGGGLGGDSIVWGSRGGGLGGDSIVWGSRGGGLGGDSIVWGSRGSETGSSLVWGSSIVWGSRGGGLGGDSIVWGSRGGGLGGDSIVWGSRGGGLGGDSIVWGSRGAGLGGDSIVWGSRGTSLSSNSIVWGSRGN